MKAHPSNQICLRINKPMYWLVAQAIQQQFLRWDRSGILSTNNATLALALAILSWTCGSLLFSVPALIIASKARDITDTITFHPDAGTAKVAYIAALVNVIVTSVLTLVWVLFMAYMILVY